MATPADNLTLHRYKCTNKGYTEDLGDGVTLTLMLIPAGEFMMGAPEDEPGSRASERPQHLVKLPQFLMGRYPVTQAQWRVVASYNREEIGLPPSPSTFKGEDLPVERVTWQMAMEFCKRLSTRTGKSYHLPNEAQWEYACRAKTETMYSFGPKLTEELANYEEQGTTSVGQFPANRWGLYDMHGNVWEWCQDHWHANYHGAPNDGKTWLASNHQLGHVVRGGSWGVNPQYCRSAFRYGGEPDLYGSLGFRIACSALCSL